jgi:hypothetical protein
MTGSHAQSVYAHDDAKLAALEQRVYGLERGVQDLNQLFTGRIGDVSAQLAGLASKLDERSRTPWATIVSAMGVVLAIVIAGGQLAKAPIEDAVRRVERDQIGLEAQATPLATFADFKATYENNRLVLRQDVDARFAGLSAAIKAVEGQAREALTSLPSRSELDERRRASEQAVEGLQRQIDRLPLSTDCVKARG